MPYADIEARRAVQRSHYARNKDAYNPGREIARAAYKVAKARIRALSQQQWVSPVFVRTICDDEVDKEYARKDYEEKYKAPGIYRLALDWCLRGTSGWLDGGVFMGESPFLPHRGFFNSQNKFTEPGEEWARAEFLKRLPKTEPPSGKVELLILNITLKRIDLYGR